MFKHDFFDYDYSSVYDITDENGRVYCIGENKYPSITTALSERDPKKKKNLSQWRERIGEDEAEYQTNLSTNYGEQLHLMCEHFLRNEEIPHTSNPLIQNMFSRAKKKLEKNINVVHGLEIPLWSHRLKIAGRVDCVATYKNQLTIIDFKNSVKPKRKQWILDYFYQATFYSLALEEMFSVKAKNILILIACHNGEIQEFEVKRKPYILPLVKYIKEYNHE